MISRAEVKAHFAPKQPEPQVLVDPKVKKHFKAFLEQPPQHVLNRKDDYTRCLTKTLKEKSSSSTASGRKSKEVAQLGKQAKQSIAPLKVLPQPTQGGIDMELAIKLAKECNVPVEALLAGGDNVAKGPIARKFVYGEPLVSD